MPWATNPLFKPEDFPEPKPKDGADVESGNDDPRQQVLDSVPTRFKVPSSKFTGHQIFYISFILDGIGAALVSGGINFAIAYAMYATDGVTGPIRLWKFPNTLAGDAALTTFIQLLITWHVELMLVNRDLKKGGVQPIGFIPEPKWSLVRWYLFLDRKEQTRKVRSWRHWLAFLRSQVVRALLLAVVFFPIVWGPSVGFLRLVGQRQGDDWYYKKEWVPQIFKLIQGAALGLLTTPLIVMFWLTRCGWALRNHEERYGER
ncbi:Uu.00g132180.m01.CDS01 [Anthostomella pinea]|uniref:Uu.00g132180.m01.CDS01 n=1 Tax=Anthostomella pinea TaxID=933095 RepID=A0AAI8VJ01_9PEZI|nr:Uu.00g132180.m01.CDS01 [Anthostomella pinea]